MRLNWIVEFSRNPDRGPQSGLPGSTVSPGHLGEEADLTTGRWLKNQVEQDHRRIKRLVRPGLEFKECCLASRTIQGYDAMSMIRNGQVVGVGKEGWETASVLAEVHFGVVS
jgi:hypothetical protein